MAALLAISMQREYSETCRYVQSRMALALARSNTMMLHRARDPEGRFGRRPVMEDGAGMAMLVPQRDD
eukprot:15299387-Ditylum_brightwellii.AAC.1